MPLNPIPFITRKRDGLSLSSGELDALVRAYVGGEIPDYQMSAWLMAVFLRGMNAEETAALTEAMLRSGQVLQLRSVERHRVDKHSTGGVGDKISICLAPAVAACGVAVPMICGRGLGHTGGTLDKLEAIPGYSTTLDAARFEHVVATVGVSIMGQTREIAPADARLYALRDVTGTVESIPLIVASILSKKLAEGIDGLVLDVKVGRGAFMKEISGARELADALVAVGTRAGKRVSALLTDMGTPIGLTIGNALETREAIDVLRGGGPPDTVELTSALGAEMLAQAGLPGSRDEHTERILRALRDGSALSVFTRMVEAHGGDPRVVEDHGRLPSAPHRIPVLAGRAGTVQRVDALALGVLATRMGAGRVRTEDHVDPAVGIELCAHIGDSVEADAPVAWLHARTDDPPRLWLDTVRESFAIYAEPRERATRILERRGSNQGSATTPSSEAGTTPLTV
jgi:pyrimidine-nucleoside phosphorylase